MFGHYSDFFANPKARLGRRYSRRNCGRRLSVTRGLYAMDDEDEQVEGEKISSKEIQDEQLWKTIHARKKKNREPDEDINPDRQVDAKSADEIGDCILRATGLQPEEVVKDSIRINERLNIIVVSAPTLESAEKYSALKELRIGDKTYEVTAYMTAPEDTSKGIIRGIPDYDTPEDIERSLVNERNPGILHAKRMGRTNLAIIVFRGTYVPHYVYYRTYRRPKCLLCGRDHPTGERKCKVRFKTPYLVKKRQWERKLQDEETLRERQRSENANRDADGAAKGQYRTQNPAQVSLPAWKQTTENERSKAESGHPRPLQVSWADAVSGGRSRIEAAPPNATTEANKELAQIKQMLLQISKDNAKLREDINVRKEENARLRNGVKDSKEVAQIAKDTEEIFEGEDEVPVPKNEGL
ncbi:hypothetical protein HPB49_026021 [Dermacentor silvarum]|nr:hypothetical protein HPB49_026021 [Dermacentor silvarum]